MDLTFNIEDYYDLWLELFHETLPRRRQPTKKELEKVQHAIAEVETRAAAIKAGWSENERTKRVVGPDGHISWTLPEYITVEVSSYGSLHSRRRPKTKIYKRMP